jgi:hypothetical protein
VPHRWATYDLSNVVPNGSLGVQLRGPGHGLQDRTRSGGTVVVARLERREYGDIIANEPLGWTPIDTVVLDRVGKASHEVTWQAVFRLGNSLPSPLRVSVLEAQALRSDPGELGDILGQRPSEREGVALSSAAMMDFRRGENLGYRIIFADATVV